MLIDFHTHAFPDQLAARALKALEVSAIGHIGISPLGDGTASWLLARNEASGVQAAVTLHIATRPTQQRAVNDFAASIRSDRLRCYGTFHPDAPDAMAEIHRVRALGLDGVKLHPDYQNFFVDEPRMFPFYRALAALRLPVLFHAGWDPISPDVVHAEPRAIARVLDEVPGLTVIAAHLCMRRLEETRKHLIGRDVYLETSLASTFLSVEEMRSVLTAHRPDRLLFGTDSPWSSVEAERAFLEAADLPHALLERILWQNAAELLGLPAALCG